MRVPTYFGIAYLRTADQRALFQFLGGEAHFPSIRITDNVRIFSRLDLEPSSNKIQSLTWQDSFGVKLDNLDLFQ